MALRIDILGFARLIEVVRRIADTQDQRLTVEKDNASALRDIADSLSPPFPLVSFSSFSSQGVTIKGDIHMAELREGQQAVATVSLKTKGGNPAAYQVGTEVWTSSDPARASVTVDPANPLQATIAGLNGAFNTPVLITFTADGDPDADQTRDVVATLDVVVTQGEAVVAEISLGTPTDTP